MSVVSSMNAVAEHDLLSGLAAFTLTDQSMHMRGFDGRLFCDVKTVKVGGKMSARFCIAASS